MGLLRKQRSSRNVKKTKIRNNLKPNKTQLDLGAQNLGDEEFNRILHNYPNLEVLYCEGNNLTKLVNLPSSLKKLCCGYNKLTKIDNLPSGLKYLNCDGNQLTDLKDLPSGLKFLKADYNEITELNDLPNSLEFVSYLRKELLSN